MRLKTNKQQKLVSFQLLMTKYKHIIDAISTPKCEIVCKPRSDWRVKVYPPPKLWLTETLCKTKWVTNKINTIRYGKKEGKQVEELWKSNS